MEAVYYTETLISAYQFTRFHNSEDHKTNFLYLFESINISETGAANIVCKPKGLL
jgi:hypothetical protein